MHDPYDSLFTTLRGRLRLGVSTVFISLLYAPLALASPTVGDVVTSPSTSPLPSTQLLDDPSLGSSLPPLATSTPAVGFPVQPANAAAAAPVLTAPQFPPVDPQIAARAQQELDAQTAREKRVNAAANSVRAPTEITPVTTDAAPLLEPPAKPLAPTAAPAATTTAEASRIAMPPRFIITQPLENVSTTPATPSTSTPVMATQRVPSRAIAQTQIAAPTQGLSKASKTILSRIPSRLNSATPAKGKASKLAINRLSPDIQALVGKEPTYDSYDAVGLSIKVQRPGLDTNFELNRAFNALMAGDSTQALETYRNILSTEPTNEDALFGAAATYHRLGDLDKARPFYAQLLKINPNHREALNNFLALIGDESPQEAVAELERLEQRNPDFSPIPAQQSLLLSKLGFFDQAREKMLRAIELAPENLTYKYNLAVMLDANGNYADASALYRLLIDASLKGQKIPGSLEILQKRLNFITTAALSKSPLGG